VHTVFLSVVCSGLSLLAVSNCFIGTMFYMDWLYCSQRVSAYPFSTISILKCILVNVYVFMVLINEIRIISLGRCRRPSFADDVRSLLFD